MKPSYDEYPRRTRLRVVRASALQHCPGESVQALCSEPGSDRNRESGPVALAPNRLRIVLPPISQLTIRKSPQPYAVAVLFPVSGV